MENFKFCIWLIPKKNHKWYKYISDFSPHVTLHSRLSMGEAYTKLFVLEDLVKDLKVKLVGKAKQDKVNDFYNIEYGVELIDKNEEPTWWPDNAHLSFSYRYGSRYTKEELEEMDKKVEVREGVLNKIVVKNCKGHYNTWEKNSWYS